MHALALVVFALLCAGPAIAVAAPVKLANRQIEIAVDPVIGRISWLSQPGGKNLLWINPAPQPMPAQGGWIDWGGDKLWWGPQIDWMTVQQRRFPPDEALDSSWKITTAIENKIVMESRRSTLVGIRAQREITLPVEGAEVIIRNQFTRETPSPHRLQLWSITQLPPPLWCWLESKARPGNPAYVNLRPQLDASDLVRPELSSDCVRVTYSPDRRFMIGTHGAWLAAVYADVIITQQIAPYPDGDYAEQVSLQLFSGPDYIELETLGGVKSPIVGQSMAGTVRWRVLARPLHLAEAPLREWIRAQLSAPAENIF